MTITPPSNSRSGQTHQAVRLLPGQRRDALGSRAVGGWSEAAGLDRGRAVRGEHGELLGRIGPQVVLGALDASVAEPQGDLADVAGSGERVHGTAVTQNVRCDALGCERRSLARGRLDMPGQSMCEAVPGHRLAVAIGSGCRRVVEHAHEPVEVRTWPQHEVVIRHNLAVVALACDLPDPIADLARLHAHRWLRSLL